MTSINDKLGIKRAGKRSMMKNLPTDRAERTRVTSATCPSCHVTGKAKVSATQPGKLYCTFCQTIFEATAE